MTNTHLIIAIVFASLFGFLTICFVMWCVGCYKHRHCLDLGQYFHTWLLQPAQSPAVVCVEKYCSKDGKGVRGRRLERLQIQRDYEYSDCEQGRIRDGNGDTRWERGYEMGTGMRDGNEDTRRPVQAHHESRRRTYRPSLKRKDPMQNMQPMMRQQIPMHWQTQGALYASPFVMHSEMPQRPSRQTVPRTSKPGQGLPRCQAQGLSRYHQPHEESVGSEASGARELKTFSVRGQSPAKHASQARRVDYIHICDEYPPMVLEALKKAAPATSATSSSSSSSSNGYGTTQEIPRTSIGCATPDYVTSSPIQFPRYCNFASSARDLSR